MKKNLDTLLIEMDIFFLNYLCTILSTGKFFSEALLFAEHGENMLCTKIVPNVINNSMNNLS